MAILLHSVALLFVAQLGGVSAAYAKFNEAFTSSMLDKVASAVALPWTPVGSIAAAFSSYRPKGSDSSRVHGYTIMDDNATISSLWMLVKPYAEKTANSIDAVYVGFENTKFIMYIRNTAYRERSISFAYSQGANYTCHQNDTWISGCYVQWNNATNPVTGAYEGAPTHVTTNFDCRNRPWYETSKASTEVRGGAAGAIWSKPYVLVQTGRVGLTAARHLVTKDGEFVGVTGADFELSTLEGLLQETAETSADTLTVFVVDSLGKMMASSVVGMVVSADGTSQVLAANSTHRVIQAVAQDVDARGGWAKTAGRVYTVDVPSLGLHWFQHLNLTDPYGLKWHVAVAQVVQCDRGYFVSLTLPEDDAGKECLPCPEGAICSGGTAMPFPKEGWWIDRSSYTAGSVAFRCLRATCEGFQARATKWAQSVHESGNNFNFGGFSTLDGASYGLDDDTAVADDDYVGLSGASLDPLACWHRAAFINASEAAYARSLQSSDYSMQLDLPQCAYYQLMCTHGSVGPLCGACEEGYVFSSSARLCVNCQKLMIFVPPLLVGIFLILALAMRSAMFKGRAKGLRNCMILRIHRICPAVFCEVASISKQTNLKTKTHFWHFDRGMLKVAWATFQILSTISWNLAVQYPEPFATVLESLSFMSMDFSAALKCSSEMNLMDCTLFAALTPVFFAFLDLLLYLARSARRRAESRAAVEGAEKERAFRPAPSFTNKSVESEAPPRLYGSYTHPVVPGMGSFSFFAARDSSVDPSLKASIERMRNQHIYFALVLSYLVLPPITMLQFHALDCVDLSTPADSSTEQNHVLRVDTMVDCESTAYKNFVLANCLLIVIYQSVPLVWFCFLWRVRHLLNPMAYDGAINLRKPTTPEIEHDSSSSHGDNEDPVKSGHESISQFVERLSQSKGMRQSAGELRSSHQARRASAHHKTKKLADEEYVVKYALAEAAREQNNSLRHLKFLWDDYKPSAWYYEVVEIYRRMLFAAAIPLLAPQGLQRAALGCVLSILAVAVVREASPFQREATNVLLVLSQYQILLTFFSAFVVASGTLASLEGSNNIFLGILLCAINAGILLAAGLILFARYRAERKQRKWRRLRTPQEVALLEQLLGKATASSHESNGNGNERAARQDKHRETLNGSVVDAIGRRLSSSIMEGQSKSEVEMVVAPSLEKDDEHKIRENATKAVLARHLLKADDVELIDRIGAGAFGEVFHGMCLGQPVAVKTMLEVTEDNVRAFRDEILLTATLRHPNIVNFVGACWGEDLTCLVLEWVPKGSLQQLLHIKDDLKWSEPLLHLASDVSRGMAYLHGREYMDEADQNKMKRCVLHRDLKPDNVLVTEFLRAKISDFGTSCAQGVDSDDVALGAVGTPLFCAPEILRGEAYDASADVYSFGLLLLAMAVKDELIEFVGESWRLYHGKKQMPRNPMRIIRTIAQDGWRAVAAPPLSNNPHILTAEIALLAPRADHLTLMERRRLDALNHALSQARTEQAPPTASNGADSAPVVLSDAPPTIVRLLVECMLSDPSQRPTFEDCMRELEGPAQREIAAMDFGRTTLAACTASVSASGTEGGAISHEAATAESFNQPFVPTLRPANDNAQTNQSTAPAKSAMNSNTLHNRESTGADVFTIVNPLSDLGVAATAASNSTMKSPGLSDGHHHPEVVKGVAPISEAKASIAQETMCTGTEQPRVGFTDV